MTPTALVADDEPLLATWLRADLARLWPELRITAVVEDGASAVEEALRLHPTVCFLDIRMPAMTGLEAAQALAEDWTEEVPFPLLVFVTAYDQYAVQAFDAQAMDYLVKPVTSARLAVCVTRLRRRLGDRGPMPLELERALQQLRALLGAHGARPAPPMAVLRARVGNTMHMVPLAEVIYFEAADKYVRVVTAEREHLIRLALRDLLPRLDAAEFWQVHRSLVVRASAIVTAEAQDFGKTLLTLRGRRERLTVSRMYSHLFRSM